ncbi:hypothetical protein MMC09_001364 [Bachmanniomyces sp. S44760]|nr:hypothetical protein [Bachmanniomyces sp. S44760]
MVSTDVFDISSHYSSTSPPIPEARLRWMDSTSRLLTSSLYSLPKCASLRRWMVPVENARQAILKMLPDEVPDGGLDHDEVHGQGEQGEGGGGKRGQGGGTKSLRLRPRIPIIYCQ